MNNLTNAITEYYISKNIIPAEKREIYSYGFQLIFADIINFAIIILSGCILSRISESVVFLITLCGVRRFCGGFHAKTFWLCRLSMIITFISVISVVSLVNSLTAKLTVIIILNFVCVVCIALLSPAEHPNKKLSVAQKKSNKIKSIIASSVFSCISVILTAAADMAEGVTISITLSAVVFLMLVGLILQKGGKENVSMA